MIKNKTLKKILLILLFLSLILILTLSFLPSLQPPQIIQTLPANQQKNVLNTQNITLQFNRSLSQKDLERLSLKTNPPTNFTQTLLENQNTLLLEPTNNLQENSTYQINIFYQDKEIYSFSFQTNLYTQQQLQEQSQKQSLDDLEFGKTYQQFLDQYPWYTQIPVQKEDYIITYNFNKQSFRISPTFQPENKQQEQKIIDQALQDLKTIGVKMEPIPYYLKYY